MFTQILLTCYKCPENTEEHVTTFLWMGIYSIADSA